MRDLHGQAYAWFFAVKSRKTCLLIPAVSHTSACTLAWFPVVSALNINAQICRWHAVHVLGLQPGNLLFHWSNNWSDNSAFFLIHSLPAQSSCFCFLHRVGKCLKLCHESSHVEASFLATVFVCINTHICCLAEAKSPEKKYNQISKTNSKWDIFYYKHN